MVCFEAERYGENDVLSKLIVGYWCWCGDKACLVSTVFIINPIL